MILRMHVGMVIGRGDAYRDAHKLPIGMSISMGMDAYCDTHTDAHRKGMDAFRKWEGCLYGGRWGCL